MSDAINAALAAANEAAAELPETSGVAPTGTAVVNSPASSGAPRSLMDVMNGAQMNVDCFLSVKPFGILIGKDTQFHDSLDVEMNFAHAKAGWVIRVNSGSGVRYLVSYDGRIEHRSRQSWAAVVAQAQAMDNGAYVSDLIELPVKLLKSYSRKEGGPIAEGAVVGLSLSHMNLQKGFQPFLAEQFPKVGERPFDVRIGFTTKVGSGQTYGVFTYEPIDDAAPAAKGAKK